MNEKKYSNLDYVAIGQQIKLLRGDMQQADFASLFGLKQQDISKIENAKLKPSLDVLCKISLHFEKTIEWILTGQGNMKNEQYEMAVSLANSVSDPDTAYQPKINIADLKAKTDTVLRSNTRYSTALKDIIVAYYEATICQEELAEKQKVLDNLSAAKES